MAIKLTRDIVVRSKFLTREDERTNEIIAVVAPNGLQIGLSGSRSVSAEFKTYDTARFYLGLSGSLTQLTDGTSYLIAGSDITITSASNGAVTVTSTGASGISTFFSSTTAGSIFTTGSTAFVGGEAGTGGNPWMDAPSDIGTDTFFFVSGTIGSIGTAVTGTAVFGGDVYVSGALHGATSISAAGSDTQVQYNNAGSLSGAPDLTFAAATGNVHLGASTGDAKLFFRDSGIYAYSKADGELDIISDTKLGLTGSGGSVSAIGILASAGGIDIDAAGAINIEAASSAAHSYITATKKQLVLSGAAGLQVKSHGGTIKIEAATGAVDVDCGTTFKVDSDGVFSIDGVGASNVTTNGALTVSGSTGLNLHSHGGEIDVTTTQVGADIDINAAGRILMTATEDSVASIELDAEGSIYFHGGDQEDAYLFYHKPMWFDTITEPANTTINKLYNVGGELRWGGTGFLCTSSAHFNSSKGALGDFQVETSNKAYAIFSDAGTDQVLILSGGAATSPNEATGADVNFYVSGSRESVGTTSRGTALFGGDLVTSGNISLVSHDPDETFAPGMMFRRISASPADSDELGRITFQGRNDADELVTYARVTAEINDASDGTEDGVIIFEVQKNGTSKSALELKNNEAVFNNGSQDINFRIESNTHASAFFMDGALNAFSFGNSSTSNAGLATAGTDAFLTVSGSIGKKGTTNDYSTTVLQGDAHISGSLYVSGTGPSATGMPKLSVGCSPTTPPKTALDVTHDYTTRTFENQLADGEGGGQRLLYGTFHNSVAAGDLCYLSQAALWANLAANQTTTSGSMMGIALDADGGADEGLVLLRGFAKIPSTIINGTPGKGLPMYASNDTAGEIDVGLPSSSGDVVRIVGYCVDIDSSDVLLYFDPDKTWVTIA